VKFQLDLQSVGDNQFGPAYATPHPDGGTFWVRPARADEIGFLHSLIASEISQDVGPAEAMQAVFAKNPVAFWVIEGAKEGVEPVVFYGMYGFMPLNEAGKGALLGKTLDRRNPGLEFIAAAGTKSAAIYVWAMVARRIGKLTYPLIRRALGPDYLDVPFYAVPATRGGTKAVADRGFSPIGGDQHGEGELSLLPPLTPPQTPAAVRFEVAVASNAEHLHMSAFIRGATFGAEQNCPYFEEFDGNDFCAMHLIGFVNGEPAATMRIRFFSEFAKLERLAVLERFRRTELKKLIMEKAIDICRRKGYTKLYGQSQERLVGFYQRFGFAPLHKNRPLVFSDHSYVEIFQELEPAESRITVDSDPYTIIRPEGSWDEAGVLEKSAIRPVTNPQHDRPAAR
jgi:predicted GNAT family N-acyltransferase